MLKKFYVLFALTLTLTLMSAKVIVMDGPFPDCTPLTCSLAGE